MTGWARGAHLRELTRAGDRRIPLGKVGFRKVSLPPRQSLLILGMTQLGKTSRLAGPALAGWAGPCVATSVKTDLLAATSAARQDRGPTWTFDPTSPCSSKWSPLEGCDDWRQAMRMAAWLTEAGQLDNNTRERQWWDWAQQLLAPMLMAAARAGTTMGSVLGWLDKRDFAAVAKNLPTDDPAPAEAWSGSVKLDGRQLSSIISTTKLVLAAFADPLVALATSTSEFTMAELLAANGTLYLVAPAHEQTRLRPIFAALVRSALAFAYEHGPLDPPLLMVLDEAANVAPLADLDQIASTCAGMGIQLVSVFQDGGQIRARYGPDLAASIWTNHPARVILPTGMLDFETLDKISRLLGDEQVAHRNRDGSISTTWRPVATADTLHQMPRGVGVLLDAPCPPARLRLIRP